MVARPTVRVTDLSVEFRRGNGWVPVVSGVSFELWPFRTLGLVGESGSGKTVTSLATMGLISGMGGRISRGSIEMNGVDLLRQTDRQWNRVRGKSIGIVFQQPMRSFNPAFTVGEQIAESARHHLGLTRRAAWKRSVELLDRVEIPHAARRASDYPHSYSGGMLQRAMIAMSLVCDPDVLIADEPTTALDVTVQAGVLRLLQGLQRENGLAILFVTHDLGVVAEICDDVCVMYAGQIVEQCATRQLLMTPRHPYSAGLLAAVPRAGRRGRLEAIRGTVPDMHALPPGCRFAPRCDYMVRGRCDVRPIELRSIACNPAIRCARSEELSLRGVDRS